MTLSRDCPNNCYEGNGADTTPNYKGMIAIMHPTGSWVAKWNEKSEKVPGLYAMHYEKQGEEVEGEEDQEMQDDFINDRHEEADEDEYEVQRSVTPGHHSRLMKGSRLHKNNPE